MAEQNKSHILHLFFLEFLSLTPVLIILGNILPPIPIKIHHIGLGLIFLLTLLLLLKDGYKKWLIYFTAIFVFLQFSLQNWDVKGMVDYFFGPFVLVLMLDTLVNNRLPKDVMTKYMKRFMILLWVSPIIAVLQYLNIVPVTFLNATYINYAYFGDVAIPRPNGFLYHGSELSIIIVFLTLFQIFKKGRNSFWVLVLLALIACTTYFKALLACVLLLIIYYLVFLNHGWLSKYKLFSKKNLIYASLAMTAAVIGFGSWYFGSFYLETGRLFPKDMLTGRGEIWNIYLIAVADFSWYNWLIGNGLGSSFDLFREYAISENWWRYAEDHNADLNYDTHNAFLSILVNSGIVGIGFIVFIFRMVYKQIVNWLPSSQNNKELFFAVFIIPLITIGITIPIYENAIFWIALSFLIWGWKMHADARTNEQ